MKYFSLLFLFLLQTQKSIQQDAYKNNNIAQSMDAIQLEKINTFYMTNLEQRIVTILTTMSSLDEKLTVSAQVSEIFRHHINSWNMNMKSVDDKLDLLKRAQEAQQMAQIPFETRLSGIEFKMQRIFEKIDTINEKLHDITKVVYTQQKKNNKKIEEPITTSSSVDIHHKLGLIERNIRLMQNHCRHTPTRSTQPRITDVSPSSMTQQIDKKDVFNLKNSLDRLNLSIEKISSKELRQVLVNNRRALRTVENIEDVVHEIDDRTVRMFDAEASHHKELSSCCRNMEHEITTFTNSADLLLKKIESLVSSKKIGNCPKDTVIIGEKEEEELGSGDDENDEEHMVIDKPKLHSCDELETRKNGIYFFENNRDINEGNRDFTQRYCQFATNGPAWTLIQRRDHLIENFNRTWNDFKLGFGTLSGEFWFGNEFINRLTTNDPMELRIEIENDDKTTVIDQYTTFHLESEKQNYKMIIHDYRDGTLLHYNGQYFSTFDKRNDKSGNLCITGNDGWWLKKDCLGSNLNEPSGMIWNSSKVKKSKMMIRSRWHSTLDSDEYLEDI